MTDNIIISDLQSIKDVLLSSVSNINSDTQIDALQPSDAAHEPLQKAATALVEYVQTIVPTNVITSDNADMLHQMATSFMQETAAAISTSTINTPMSTTSDVNISDSTIPATLTQAASSFVDHLGNMLLNPEASDTPSPQILMQDLQTMWQNKSPTDTAISTAASIWDSVKSSQHLPVIAGMLASVFFKKK